MGERDVARSRFLSFVLRHRPDEVGLVLDGQGWADVEELLDRCAESGHPMTVADLHGLVGASDKQRFELNGNRIRAAQGHSVVVDLGLEPRTPPPVLFHGTVERFLASILANGLEPRDRQHVHLSSDIGTATAVGARRGKPVLLRIDAEGLHRHGQIFWRSANGVWLTELVQPRWISVHEPG